MAEDVMQANGEEKTFQDVQDSVYCIELTGNDLDNPEAMDCIQDLLDAQATSLNKHVANVATSMGISQACAADVVYLRTRNRHTDELEAELIHLHQIGTPPNMCEFGVTEKTQAALMTAINAEINNINGLVTIEPSDGDVQISPGLINAVNNYIDERPLEELG